MIMTCQKYGISNAEREQFGIVDDTKNNGKSTDAIYDIS